MAANCVQSNMQLTAKNWDGLLFYIITVGIVYFESRSLTQCHGNSKSGLVFLDSNLYFFYLADSNTPFLYFTIYLFLYMIGFLGCFRWPILCWLLHLACSFHLRYHVFCLFQVINKFYEILERETGSSGDYTWQGKCSRLLDDPSDSWVFNSDSKTSTLKYIVNLKTLIQSMITFYFTSLDLIKHAWNNVSKMLKACLCTWSFTSFSYVQL